MSVMGEYEGEGVAKVLQICYCTTGVGYVAGAYICWALTGM